MPYEAGGRADKSGNRYEIKCMVYQMLRVLEEQIFSVTLEALGDSEKGIDIWIKYFDDHEEGQQCKGRNGSEDSWTIYSMKSHGILKSWRFQLDRNKNNEVALVSPLACLLLIDLINRAKNTDGNYIHFYINQICKASNKLKKFYEDYMVEMGLDITVNQDILKSIDYLSRTHYRIKEDSELTEDIFNKIRYLFVGNYENIFDSFITLIVDGDILGKEINSNFLYTFCEKRNFEFKDLAFNKKIVPRIKELNMQYRMEYKLINDKLIQRKDFEKCNKLIDCGKSIIIHGKAGNCKSGCTEEILNYCESKLIPIIAIKLDKRTPSGNTDKWGKELGLPGSIAHCLHSISKNTSAVLILDQLDALRWTQAHSRDSLIVCTEIINEVRKLNLERNKNISVIFVCRTYDLENDNNIKMLFNSDNNSKDL